MPATYDEIARDILVKILEKNVPAGVDKTNSETMALGSAEVVAKMYKALVGFSGVDQLRLFLRDRT